MNEGDAVLREKSRRNDALMFGISIRPLDLSGVQIGNLSPLDAIRENLQLIQ